MRLQITAEIDVSPISLTIKVSDKKGGQLHGYLESTEPTEPVKNWLKVWLRNEDAEDSLVVKSA